MQAAQWSTFSGRHSWMAENNPAQKKVLYTAQEVRKLAGTHSNRMIPFIWPYLNRIANLSIVHLSSLGESLKSFQSLGAVWSYKDHIGSIGQPCLLWTLLIPFLVTHLNVSLSLYGQQKCGLLYLANVASLGHLKIFPTIWWVSNWYNGVSKLLRDIQTFGIVLHINYAILEQNGKAASTGWDHWSNRSLGMIGCFESDERSEYTM